MCVTVRPHYFKQKLWLLLRIITPLTLYPHGHFGAVRTHTAAVLVSSSVIKASDHSVGFQGGVTVRNARVCQFLSVLSAHVCSCFDNAEVSCITAALKTLPNFGGITIKDF